MAVWHRISIAHMLAPQNRSSYSLFGYCSIALITPQISFFKRPSQLNAMFFVSFGGSTSFCVGSMSKQTINSPEITLPSGEL
jgi:hypothetical protein